MIKPHHNEGGENQARDEGDMGVSAAPVLEKQADAARASVVQDALEHELEALPPTQTSLRWRKFRRSRLGLWGGAVVVLLYCSAIFADFLAPYQPLTTHVDRVHVPPQWPSVWGEGGLHWPALYDVRRVYRQDGLERGWEVDRTQRHPIRFFVRGEPYRFWGLFSSDLHLMGAKGMRWFPLGTDGHGRDQFSRLLHGGRISLTIGLFGVAVSLVLGTLIGTLSGYFGGWIDSLIQRGIELLLTFPSIPLWMALAAALPPEWSPIKIYFGIVTILSLIGWGGLARQVRGLVLAYREGDHVKAARSFGAWHSYIIMRHLVPACTGHLIVITTLSIPGTILGETALSFLGLGIRPPMTSWGVLLQEAQHVRVLVQFPWLLLPAVPVLLTVVAFNFLGDALRDALDTDV